MKKLLILLIIIALGFFGQKAFKAELARNLSLNAKVSVITDVFDNIGRGVSGAIGNTKKTVINAAKKMSTSYRAVPSENTPIEVVTLIMKHGGKMTGKLLKKDSREYVIEVKDEKYVIPASRVNRIESITQKDAEWPYKNDVVLKRTNGIVLDGEIVNVSRDAVTLLFTEGGGQAEADISRKDISRLIFAPVCDKETEKREKLIKTQFPKMKVYKEGNVTIITDAYATAVNSYKREISSLYTELYLTFFKLFKDRKPLNH